MKPLTAQELKNLPLGTKLKIHLKLLEYMVTFYGRDRDIISAVYTLKRRESAPADCAGVVLMNDSDDEEREKIIVDQEGWTPGVGRPALVLASSSARSVPVKAIDPTYCSCDSPDVVQRSTGTISYGYCKSCRKEHKN